jgi:hypothetical protein
MLRRALLPALLLALAVASAGGRELAVWTANWGEATVSEKGIRTPGGTALDYPLRRLDASRLVRLDSDGQGENSTLTVTDAAGRRQARRKLDSPALSSPTLWGTVRGPCVQDHRPRQRLTCYTPDLKTVWKSLPGKFTLVTRDGTTPFLYAEPSQNLWLNLMRVDLKSGQRTVWRVSTLRPGQTEAGRGDLFRMYDRDFEASVLRELPANRVLACVRFSLTRSGCRYHVLDAQTGKRRVTLNADGFNTAFVTTPEVSRNGKYLVASGNTVHLWETASGRQLLSLRDPAWARAFAAGAWVEPSDVLFTQGERQMVVLVRDGNADWTAQYAFVYALPSGRRVTSFPVTFPLDSPA